MHNGKRCPDVPVRRAVYLPVAAGEYALFPDPAQHLRIIHPLRKEDLPCIAAIDKLERHIDEVPVKLRIDRAEDAADGKEIRPCPSFRIHGHHGEPVARLQAERRGKRG